MSNLTIVDFGFFFLFFSGSEKLKFTDSNGKITLISYPVVFLDIYKVFYVFNVEFQCEIMTRGCRLS